MRTFVYPARFDRGDKPGVLVISFRDVPGGPFVFTMKRVAILIDFAKFTSGTEQTVPGLLHMVEAYTDHGIVV